VTEAQDAIVRVVIVGEALAVRALIEVEMRSVERGTRNVCLDPGSIENAEMVAGVMRDIQVVNRVEI
jgi:hypothetical protein